MTLVCGFLFLSTRYSFVRRDEVEVEVGGSTALRHVFFFLFFFFYFKHALCTAYAAAGAVRRENEKVKRGDELQEREIEQFFVFVLHFHISIKINDVLPYPAYFLSHFFICVSCPLLLWRLFHYCVEVPFFFFIRLFLSHLVASQ